MTIHKFFKKKKRLGFSEKPIKERTREEVNQEYNHHAVMYGHITRIVSGNQKLLDQHLEAMHRLNEEASRLPPDAPKPDEAETPPQEPVPA